MEVEVKEKDNLVKINLIEPDKKVEFLGKMII